MLKNILLVAIGGGIGSALRYLTAVFIQRYFSSGFPLATLLVNVIGCFLIGILIGTFQRHQLTDSNLKWLLVTGFCGGFTTFSAFGIESIVLFEIGNQARAFLYIGSSVILGLFAVWLGLFVSQ